jgi:hypothetical protein
MALWPIGKRGRKAQVWGEASTFFVSTSLLPMTGCADLTHPAIFANLCVFKTF